MAKLNKRFDSKKHGDMGFTPLPAGEYVVMVTKSEVKETAKKTGEMVVLLLTVVDGDYKGRTIFERINYRNDNQTAQEIGQKELASLTRAIFGFDKEWVDTEELHKKLFKVKVGVKESTGQWPASNNCLMFSPLNGPTVPDSDDVSGQEPPEIDEEDIPWD